MGKALKQSKWWHLPPLCSREYLFRQVDQFILPGWPALSDVALHCTRPSSSLWLKQSGTQEGTTAPLKPHKEFFSHSIKLRHWQTSPRLWHVVPYEHYQPKQLQCLLLRIVAAYLWSWCWQWWSNKTTEQRRCSKLCTAPLLLEAAICCSVLVYAALCHSVLL